MTAAAVSTVPAVGERVARIGGVLGTVVDHDRAADGSPLVWVKWDDQRTAPAAFAVDRVIRVDARHRPKIARRMDPSWGRVYQFRCTCGARGEEYAARQMARADEQEHVAALPRVPADQQCADPQRHGTRPWERCGVCADQLSLFDLS